MPARGSDRRPRRPAHRSARSPGRGPRWRIWTAPEAPMTATSAPGQARQTSLPMPRESMTMYAPPKALRKDEAQAGHGRLRIREGQLGTVADHAAPLEVLAGQEARRIDQADDGQVEGVAEPYEAGPLLRRGDVEGPSEDAGLVGHEPDRHPAESGESPSRSGRPTGATTPGTRRRRTRRDHVPGVVGRRLAVGDHGRAARAWAEHGVADGDRRRNLVGVRGQILEQLGHGAVHVVRLHRAQTPLDVAWTAVTPPSS
jgi:hypothetical protein